MSFTLTEIITILQVFALPILGLIWLSVKKIHRGNKLNGYKITALVYAIQMESKNGFAKAYEKKLEQLLEDINFIEDK